MLRPLATALLLAATVLPPPAAAAETTWYVGHVGADTCVPLADLDPANPGQRLYYGGGPLRDPAAFVELLAGGGVSLVAVSGSTDDVRIYRDVGNDVDFAFFADLDTCRVLMATLRR